MIKLQLVVTPSRRDPQHTESISRLLQALGIRATARGLATVSGTIDEVGFRRLWGDPPDTSAGFATATDGAELAVPDALREYVDAIAVPIRHTTMTPGSQR